MDARNESGRTPKRGWWDWLGLSPTDDRDAAASPMPPPPQSSRDPTAREVWLPAKRRLLGRLADFLIDHDLEILPFTLGIAYDCVTGGNPQLGQKILERTEKGLPLTIKWLEDVCGATTSNDSAQAIATIIEQLDASMGDVARTMTGARSAACHYTAALQDHVDAMRRFERADAPAADLARLTLTMLERTRQIEQELARSERRAAQLQAELDETRRQSEQDPLTGLPNRRAFDALFERELRDARAAGEPLCVAFCDVDNIRRINDAHGHPTGDRVLKLVAQTLSRISDSRCHVARHGGEEFALVFRGLALPQAWAQLDAARAEIADRRLINRITELPLGRVTLSGGIADALAHGTRASALKAADDALQLAKQGGCNCIVIAGDEPPEPRRKAA